jgi:hypothetical protein
MIKKYTDFLTKLNKDLYEIEKSNLFENGISDDELYELYELTKMCEDYKINEVAKSSLKLYNETCKCTNCQTELDINKNKYIAFGYSEIYGYPDKDTYNNLKTENNGLYKYISNNTLKLREDVDISLKESPYSRLVKRIKEISEKNNKLSGVATNLLATSGGTPAESETVSEEELENVVNNSGGTGDGTTNTKPTPVISTIKKSITNTIKDIRGSVKSKLFNAFNLSLKGRVFCDPVCKWDFCHSDRDLYKICSSCKGKGEVEKSITDKNKPELTTKKYKCTNCDGRGYEISDSDDEKVGDLSKHKSKFPLYKDDGESKSTRENQISKLRKKLNLPNSSRW